MITLQQLRYFRELAKTEHLTQTAQQLHITQTTLSNTIINLERQLGVKLFDRTGRNLRLNEIGQAYLTHISQALAALDTAQTVIDDYREDAHQSVSVATFSSTVWSDLIHDFHTRYSTYNIRQLDCDKARFRDLLLDQEVDFVIAGTQDIPLSGLEHFIIRVEPLFLCVPVGHPLSTRPQILLKDTKGEDFINLPESNGFRGFCDDLFQKAGIAYRAALECDYTMRGKLVAAGFGVAITTNITRQLNLMGDNVIYIPIADSFARRSISLIWNPRHYLSRAALDFRDFVMKQT